MGTWDGDSSVPGQTLSAEEQHESSCTALSPPANKILPFSCFIFCDAINVEV